jgi:hypothetical protein
VLVTWKGRCSSTLRWSTSGKEALLRLPQPGRVSLATGTLTPLPAPPQGTLRALEFGSPGVLAFTDREDPGTDLGHAWAWELSKDAWRRLEDREVSTLTLPFEERLVRQLGAFKRVQRREGGPRFQTERAADGGAGWVNLEAGVSRLRFLPTGTDACLITAPLFLRVGERWLELPAEGWPEEPCRNVAFAGPFALLDDTLVEAPSRRAALIDLRTGALVLTLPAEEQDAQLSSFK